VVKWERAACGNVNFYFLPDIKEKGIEVMFRVVNLTKACNLSAQVQISYN
jgi:hypothetical protein